MHNGTITPSGAHVNAARGVLLHTMRSFVVEHGLAEMDISSHLLMENMVTHMMSIFVTWKCDKKTKGRPIPSVMG